MACNCRTHSSAVPKRFSTEAIKTLAGMPQSIQIQSDNIPPLPICEEHYCVARSIEYLLDTFPEFTNWEADQWRFTDNAQGFFNLLDRVTFCSEWLVSWSYGQSATWDGTAWQYETSIDFETVKQWILSDCPMSRYVDPETHEIRLFETLPCYAIGYSNYIRDNGLIFLYLSRECHGYKGGDPPYDPCGGGFQSLGTATIGWFARCNFIQPGSFLCCDIPGLTIPCVG